MTKVNKTPETTSEIINNFSQYLTNLDLSDLLNEIKAIKNLKDSIIRFNELRLADGDCSELKIYSPTFERLEDALFLMLELQTKEII